MYTNHYKRIIFWIIVLILLILLTPPVKAEAPKPVYVKPLTISDRIAQVFEAHAPIMEAIFMAESGMNPKAVGYNCHYYTPEGKKYSKACKPEDRHRAWSVDCGIAQINYKGTICPIELLNEEISINKAKEKFDTQGLKAWTVYTNGSYKKFL